MLVALGVLAMTVGLIRSETAGDLRTLTATGASSATRRTLNAATAGALALLGGILGTGRGLPRADRLALARPQLPQTRRRISTSPRSVLGYRSWHCRRLAVRPQPHDHLPPLPRITARRLTVYPPTLPDASARCS